MNIRLAVNLSELLSEKEKMEINGRLPEFVAKTLAVALRDLAEANARNKIGNGGFGQELAEGVIWVQRNQRAFVQGFRKPTGGRMGVVVFVNNKTKKAHPLA